MPPDRKHCQSTAKLRGFQWYCLPPPLLEDLFRNLDFLSQLGRLQYVSYSGGPLACNVDDQVVSWT